MKQESTKPGLIVAGNLVILRDRLPSDVSSFVRWQTRGEWRAFDAPWEAQPITEEFIEKIKQRFLESCAQALPSPRKRAMICTKKNKPLGWVNRYLRREKMPDSWYVGIDICEDDHLNKGMGTEALDLWVIYLFSHSDVHRIGLDTWSFNKRMIRVAEKVGFVFEGVERELIKWQGSWLDLKHFGMLRGEWEERQTV